MTHREHLEAFLWGFFHPFATKKQHTDAAIARMRKYHPYLFELGNGYTRTYYDFSYEQVIPTRSNNMSDQNQTLYCKCGKEMVLAPGLDYYCPDPLCKIQRDEFWSTFREQQVKRMEYPGVAVGVLVFNDKGQILLGKRKGELGTGEYSLPGGKVDFGETPYQAAIREIKEETNLDLEKIQFTGKVTNDYFPDKGKHYLTLYYTSTASNFEDLRVMEPEKIEGWGWYSTMDIPQPCWMHTGELVKNGSLLKTTDIDG